MTGDCPQSPAWPRGTGSAVRLGAKRKAPRPAYAELHCLSDFSFQRGASSAMELMQRAKALGYSALAITDECSMAGIVRAHEAAQQYGMPLVIGTEIRLDDGLKLVLLASSHAGYAHLCELITRGRRRAAKGEYHLTRSDLIDGEGEGLPGCLALWTPGTSPDVADARWIGRHFPGRAWIAVELHRDFDDATRLCNLQQLGRDTGLPLVAAGDVHMHVRARRMLQDTLTAIHHGCTLARAGHRLFPNGERHLRSRERLAHIYPAPLLAESVRIAELCRFSLSELRYCYPHELVPAGETPAGHLRALTEHGMHERWPKGTPAPVREQVARELSLITEMGYEHYFLTVHDIVRFARSQGILCQGRGSAANSAVCFCLRITEVDPAHSSLLFERFISKERGEPPDIDVDFEHERREEVIQYVYEKYGRQRAAIAATVITYRPRSAIRDVGKALGLSLDCVDRLAKSMRWWDGNSLITERLAEAGMDPAGPVAQRLVRLVGELLGMPRHLSQHVGGFVISETPLARIVPVENAAMPRRTIIQWDKDDLDTLGLLKIDLLALGMLSAIHRAFDLVQNYRGVRYTMADLLARQDERVYHMIQQADTVGVFQIESRAQQAMLPRLKPEQFYELVIQVAIVRPGPIQGDMVHPYLRRKQGLEAVTLPAPALEPVLGRTRGVPIFQEQVMQIAIVAAGFTPGQADALRRSMAAWRRRGTLEQFQKRLIAGMIERGYCETYARRICRQIEGFAEYGFPESHAASFALLVYVSAWLKCHEPAAFTAALLNSQPMGFYAPAQLVQDARRHAVRVRPVDVCKSAWDCSLETTADGQPAIRLGLRLIKGLSHDGAERLATARAALPFTGLDDLVRRAHLTSRDRQALSRAGAFASLAGNRHQAHWQALGVERLPGLLVGASVSEAAVELPPPSEAQNLVSDYASLGLTLGRHPLALLRSRLQRLGAMCVADWRTLPDGRPARLAGLVVSRQRPSAASGVLFVTLEDETGSASVIIWPRVAERQRRVTLESRLMVVTGQTQREGEVRHLIARRLDDQSRLLGDLPVGSRDFR